MRMKIFLKKERENLNKEEDLLRISVTQRLPLSIISGLE